MKKNRKEEERKRRRNVRDEDRVECVGEFFVVGKLMSMQVKFIRHCRRQISVGEVYRPVPLDVMYHVYRQSCR